jgi:phage terminase small subunit
LPNQRLAALKGDLRLVASHPRPVVAEPPKPEDLGPVASKTWDAVVPELVRLGLVRRLDGPMVELFCTSFERWREHPGGPGYASLTAAVAHAARDLGLGSGARQRMTAPASDRDKLERSIFGTDV